MNSGIIEIPEFFGDFLAVSIDINDHNDDHIQGMVDINQACYDFAAGLLDADTFMGILDNHGIDPDAFIDEVGEEIKRLSSPIVMPERYQTIRV